MVLALLISDIISCIVAFFLAYFLRDKGIFRFFLDEIQPIQVYLIALPAAILLLLIIFSFSRLYEPKQRVTRLSEMYVSIQATTIWTLLIMAGSYLTKFDYSRIIVILLYVLTSIFVIVGRLIVRNLQIRFSPYGFGRTNILIVGNGREAREIARRLEKYQKIGMHFLGFIADKKRNKNHVIGKLSDLYKIISKYQVHEVYMADPKLSHERMLRIIANYPDKNTKFKITSNIFELITGSVDIADLESIPSLDVGRVQFPWWKAMYKRIFDIIFAIMLLIISLPIWLLIIIAIKLDSPGKAIFSQERVGMFGKNFHMLKFRTMKKISSRHGNRVTKVGKLLRKTSLDELPQLINILKGDMSVVGPRPELPTIVKKYNQWEKRRLLVKPGLTGLWQILGRKDLPLAENLEYDFYYINNQSIILDIVIILKTIPQVIMQKGAY